ncbi:MAG: phosphotransferase [Clostridia bacterium]|nr:phosphotransferase [Clostridia bacterium]
MDQTLYQILDCFQLEGNVIDCHAHGNGLINKTFSVETDSHKRYVLQTVNHHIFQDIDRLMNNIQLVTSHLAEQTDDPRRVMHLTPTKKGDAYLAWRDGSFWRVFEFVEDAICLERPETPRDFYECAVAFGEFQQMLKDFPADTLYEVIPNFHNTPDRFRIFREALAADRVGRAKEVQAEIDFALSHEQEAGQLVTLLEAGELPLRVTHNDTKINNVMLDAKTRTALCVVDLDTVMPGLSLYDYGDAVRGGASTGDEDEKDLSKVELDLAMFESFTKGYLAACPNLTQRERECMPLGVKTIALELGLRFLTDYLDGDRYFATKREDQNLDRCRTQFKLVQDMEAKWDQMNDFIANL